VNPGQTEFFAEGYPDPGKPDGVSFDYDCNNIEQSGSNSPSTPAPQCQGLSVVGLACLGSGYQRTARGMADGVNDLCGSEIVIRCETQGLSCVSSPLAVQTPFTCR
jgi:hypothetical protein